MSKMMNYSKQFYEQWCQTQDQYTCAIPQQIHALAQKVLVVAVWRVDGWCAYCDAVPGYDHQKEYTKVMESGCKLDKDVALAIFPQFNEIPYAY